MGEKISQEELNLELEELVNDIYGKAGVLACEEYIKYWEEEGYEVKKFQEKLELIKILTIMPENYLHKKYNQN